MLSDNKFGFVSKIQSDQTSACFPTLSFNHISVVLKCCGIFNNKSIKVHKRVKNKIDHKFDQKGKILGPKH